MATELWHGTADSPAAESAWRDARTIFGAQDEHGVAFHTRMALMKRVFDIAFSCCVLLGFLPIFLLIALAIKLDSRGPVFYLSDRIGKYGRVFRCVKFRTMVADADERKADILHMNERDDVLFKVSNDPRVTALGRFMRKYSIDEFPQFWNVLKGEMSVVGPRPPLGSEVQKYEVGICAGSR
jgi:lipopolysaccharide/colanic/teichoic acid biosynthesis glycosyltransferase